MSKPVPTAALTSLREILAILLDVEESSLTVIGEMRRRDSDGKEALSVDIRINGELLSAEQQAQVEGILAQVSQAAQEVAQARMDIFGKS